MRTPYRWGAAALAAALCAFGAECAPPSVSVARPVVLRAPVELSIVGTSDLHGRVAALPRLGAYVSALRAARPGRVVLVDAGDMFQGTLESDLNEGEAVFAIYRLLGYDAVAIGNHEFDYGPDGPHSTPQSPAHDPRGALRARARQAMGAFPVLTANVFEGERAPEWENVRPSTLVSLPSGLRVGVIGVTTEDTPRVTIAANFSGLRVLPLAARIAAEASTLRSQGAHVVVVAAHAGGKCKRFGDPDDLTSCDGRAEIVRVAQALPRGAVDAIVAGHTHAGMAHRVAGIPIVQAYAYGKGFGRVDLTFDPAAGAVVRSKLHAPQMLAAPADAYEGQPLAADARVEAVVQAAMARARARRGEALAVHVEDGLRRSYDGESALGNFMSSMILDVAPRAQVAIMNGGGLRADLPAGPLSYGALYDVMPFDNRLALVTMTGRELRETIARNLSDSVGILSFAGARIHARCDAAALRVDVLLDRPVGATSAPSSVSQGAVPLRDDEDVVVATNDFLATGGDGFPRVQRMTVPSEGPILRDAIADRLRASPSRLKPARLRPGQWLAPERPRIRLPRPRPVRCDEG